MAGQMVLYKRVSTEYGQKTDRQAFNCGIEFDRVFEDKQSGKDRDRPQLK